MPKKNEGTTIERDIYYVVDVSTALNFADLFDPNSDLPERHLIIPGLCYQRTIKKFHDKNDEKGEAACELSVLIRTIIKKGKIIKNRDYKEYTLGEKLHVIFDNKEHFSEKEKLGNISGDGIIDALAVALHWKAKNGFADKIKILSNDTTVDLAALDTIKREDIINFELKAYTGWIDVSDNAAACNRWAISKTISKKEFEELCPDYDLCPHEFVFFTEDSKQYRIDMIGRYDGDENSSTFGYIVPLEYYKTVDYTKPRNRYQACAIEIAAMPPDVCLCGIFIGPAGSGKTRIGLGVALELTGLLDGKYTSTSTQEKGKKSKGDKGGKGDKPWKLANIQNAEAEQAEQALSEEEQYIGSDVQGNPRIIQPMTPPGIRPLLKNRQPTANYLYDKVVFVPPKQMLYEQPPVPGDRLEKNKELLAPYSTIVPMILSDKHDKKPGGQFYSDNDILYKTEQIINSVAVYTLGGISGQNFLYRFALHDEIQKETLTELETVLERVDTGGKVIFMGDPGQRNNRYGAAGSPAVRFTRLNKMSPYAAVVVFPHDNNAQTVNCIERPGGRAAMYCKVRTATY